MLDQNTDRMWYVIGAVLIGASIIFATSGLSDTVFASVTGMFGGVTDGVERTLEQYGENMVESRVIHQHQKGIIDLSNFESDGEIILSKHSTNSDGLYLDLNDMNLETDTEYILSYSFERLEGVLLNVGGHLDNVFRNHEFYINGVDMYPIDYTMLNARLNDGWHNRVIFNDHTDQSKIHAVELRFTTPSSFEDLINYYGNNRLAIQPNRGVLDDIQIRITNLSLVEVIK